MEAMKNGVSLRAAAKRYSIPRTTLRRHVQETNKFAVGKKKVFDAQLFLPKNRKVTLQSTS